MNKKFLEPIIIKFSDIRKPRKRQPPPEKTVRDMRAYSRKSKHKEDYYADISSL